MLHRKTFHVFQLYINSNYFPTKMIPAMIVYTLQE